MGRDGAPVSGRLRGQEQRQHDQHYAHGRHVPDERAGDRDAGGVDRNVENAREEVEPRAPLRQRAVRARDLGRENNGFYQIMHGFQTERLIMALGSVASAQHCVDITLKYAKERQAFGRPIGTFQVNRHKFADMLTWIEAARRLTYHTIWLLINDLECAKEVAMCKIFACEMAVKVADMCIQIHGGYGYMMEYEVQRIWRDQRIQPIGGGTSEVQKEIIGKLLGL